MARVAILVSESGVTSLSVLADGTEDQASGVALLDHLRPDIEAFDRRLKARRRAAARRAARSAAGAGDGR
jgi:hypothetical protein